MSSEQQTVVNVSITATPTTTTNYIGSHATATAAAAAATTTTTTVTTTSTTSTTNFSCKSGLDELLQPIFYFPGMSGLVGSALSEGVYVAEKLRDIGLEDFEDKWSRKDRRTDGGSDVVRSVKNQVTALTSDFRGLQNLLGKLPTFMSADSTGNPSYHRSQDVDEPIHGEFYFPEIQKFENIKT